MSTFSFPSLLTASELYEQTRSEWLNVHRELLELQPPSNDYEQIKKSNDLKNTEWKKRIQFCTLLAQNYLAGRINGKDLTEGFRNSPHYQSIMSTFSTMLITESLKKLKTSKSPAIKKLMSDYQIAYGDNAIPIFQLTGAYIDRESPTEEKGGFHRGKGSIFMDISRVESGEFLFIFMHELFHALDSQLFNSSAYFSEKTNFEEIMLLSKKYSSKDELNKAQEDKLNKWIMAGLDRGLFAEWRAWNHGFSVYKDGLSEKLWNKIPFVEQVFSYKDLNESLSQFTYRYLNERAWIKDDVLQRALIQETIELQRKNFIIQ